MDPLAETESTQREDATSIDAIVDGLQELLADTDSFLSQWFTQLQQDVAILSPTEATEEGLKKQIEAFRLEKQQWEAKRAIEKEQIEEQTRHLTDAWLRLETEQRSMLQQQAARRTMSAEKTARTEAEETNPRPATTCRAAEEQNRLPRVTNHQTRLTDTIGPSQSAVQQFQRLKREIESSRPSSAGNNTSR